MIRIDQVSKSFGKLEVLKDISCTFEQQGRIVAILGPNGSGKTTLIKSILGMVLPDVGEISVVGQPIRGRWAYREAISYLPQIARFPDNLRVIELLRMVQDLRQQPAHPEQLIKRFGLTSHLHKRLSTLSGGTRQKVNLVLAFMYDTPLLILDEPTAGLDPVAIIQLKEMLGQAREKGKLVLLTTHIMPLVEELADEVVFLLDGRIKFRNSIEVLKHTFNAANVEQAIARLLLNSGNAHRSLDRVSSVVS